MIDPVAAGERFLAISGDLVSIRQIARFLKDDPGNAGRTAPTCALPTWLMRVVALFDPQVRGVLPELGHRKNATNEKACWVLNCVLRSPQAVLAIGQILLKLGLC